MANSLTAANRQKWTAEMQEVFYKDNVAIGVANADLRAYLEDGTRVNKPYRSNIGKSQTYTKGTAITTYNDLTVTNEYLDVDTTKVIPFYIDDLKNIFSFLNIGVAMQ